MSRKATTIVRVESLHNQTPGGRPSATGARRLAQYFAYGRGTRAEQYEREQRGEWISEDGKRLRHEAVIDWINRQGKAHRFTHQLILSARGTQLSPEAYVGALRAGGIIQEWRLIAHQDSAHPHAHVLAFGNQPAIARGREFQEWFLTVRRALERRQEQQLQYEQEQQLQYEQEKQLQYEQEKQWQLESKGRARQVEKEASLSQGLEL